MLSALPLLCLLTVPAAAQQADPAELLRRFLLPRQLYAVHRVREYIADLPERADADRQADLRRVDEIYAYALYVAEGDAYEALFAAAVATLPYRRFPARIPLLGIDVSIPVSTESQEMFRKRLKNLPGRLFLDTPPSLDRDKLPHFFGSAYLQLVGNNPELVYGSGNFVEHFEAAFKIEGFRDIRDLRVNALGVRFARCLQHQLDVPPSLMFRMYDAVNHGQHDTPNTSRR